MEIILLSGKKDRRPKGNSHKQVPVEFQLDILGLTPKKIEGLRGKRILDIGCGNGSLVSYLRENGVRAEGIDPTAPENVEYFMSRLINGTHSGPGAIPRADESYDLITAFQNTTLNAAFSATAEEWEEIYLSKGHTQGSMRRSLDMNLEDGQCILYEVGRVLKHGGSTAIYPAIPRAKENTKQVFTEFGITESEKPTNKLRTYAYRSWERPGPQEQDPAMAHRTVLHKK